MTESLTIEQIQAEVFALTGSDMRASLDKPQNSAVLGWELTLSFRGVTVNALVSLVDLARPISEFSDRYIRPLICAWNERDNRLKAEPPLLRIPTISRTTADLLGVAARLDLPHAVLLGQRPGGGFVFLTTDISTAEANWMVDNVKAILLGPAPELMP